MDCTIDTSGERQPESAWSLAARVTRLVAEKFVLSTFPRALTTLSSMCSRAVRALESSPGLIMMMDKDNLEALGDSEVLR